MVIANKKVWFFSMKPVPGVRGWEVNPRSQTLAGQKPQSTALKLRKAESVYSGLSLLPAAPTFLSTAK